MITISKKIFAQAMEFQRKVGKARALGLVALRSRDTVVFQIHSARSYTKCPRRRSRVSQDVRGSSMCEGEAWNRPGLDSRRCDGTLGVHCPLSRTLTKKPFTLHPCNHTRKPYERNRKIKRKRTRWIRWPGVLPGKIRVTVCTGGRRSSKA